MTPKSSRYEYRLAAGLIILCAALGAALFVLERTDRVEFRVVRAERSP